MSKTKGIKIVIGLVVGVLATTVIICAAVPQVRQSIKDMISKTASEKTPEEKENERKKKYTMVITIKISLTMKRINLTKS